MVPSHIPQIACDLIEGGSDVGCRISDWIGAELVGHIPQTAALISIDGFDGVGKTTIGDQLAAEICSQFVDLDDYPNKNQGAYLDALRIDDLSDALVRAINSGSRVIVSGCLVEEALKLCRISPDYRIYVMRTSRMRSGADHAWIDEHDVLYGDTTDDELNARLEEQTLTGAK